MESRGRYGYLLRSLIVVIDFLCLNLVYALVCIWGSEDSEFRNKLVWLLLNFAYFPVVMIFSGIHNRRIVYIDHVLINATQAIAVHALIFIALLSFLKLDGIHSTTLVEYYSIFFMVICLWWVSSRKILKYYRSKGYNFKRVIIVGAEKTGLLLYNELQSDIGYGYKFMGFFDDNLSRKDEIPMYKGVVDDVEDYVRKNNIDEIYCALPSTQDVRILRLLKFSEANTVSFFIVPEASKYMLRRLHFQMMGRVPVFSVREEPLQNPLNSGIKRAFDIIFSSVVLLCSPFLFLPIAIAVKLSSPGPVFFKQRRTGFRGQEFSCYKFRTMKVNDCSDTLQATKNDPRKTRIGEFLRKTSLDELPQFINVFMGDMSVIGPRPHMVKHTQDYSQIIDKYMLRHLIKPGITGWAQVNGYRGETRELWQMEKRVEYDVWYLENWNFWLDIKIIFLTLYNAVKGEKNAF